MTLRSSRTESREVWPFAHADKAFDLCALRIDRDTEMDPRRSVFTLDEHALSSDVNYEFMLKLSVDQLSKSTLVQPDQIDVAIIFENDDARRHEMLQRWRLVEMPTKAQGVVRFNRYGPRRFRFRLAAFLAQKRASAPTFSANRLGSVLADRRFSIGPSPESLFKVNWTSFIGQAGWDPNALWRVEVINADLFGADAEGDEVLKVHLNKDLPTLHALWESSATRSPRLSPVAALLRPLIASQILCDLCEAVLGHLARSRENVPTDRAASLDTTSLAGRLLSKLRKATHLDDSELIRLAGDAPEELSMRLQGLLGVGKKYDRGMLERLRS